MVFNGVRVEYCVHVTIWRHSGDQGDWAYIYSPCNLSVHQMNKNPFKKSSKFSIQVVNHIVYSGASTKLHMYDYSVIVCWATMVGKGRDIKISFRKVSRTQKKLKKHDLLVWIRKRERHKDIIQKSESDTKETQKTRSLRMVTYYNRWTFTTLRNRLALRKWSNRVKFIGSKAYLWKNRSCIGRLAMVDLYFRDLSFAEGKFQPCVAYKSVAYKRKSMYRFYIVCLVHTIFV